MLILTYPDFVTNEKNCTSVTPLGSNTTLSCFLGRERCAKQFGCRVLGNSPKYFTYLGRWSWNMLKYSGPKTIKLTGGPDLPTVGAICSPKKCICTRTLGQCCQHFFRCISLY